MPEAARCPKCDWGRLTYPAEIKRGYCVGCEAKKRGLKNPWELRPMRPYRSEDNMYGQRGVYDDD